MNKELKRHSSSIRTIISINNLKCDRCHSEKKGLFLINVHISLNVDNTFSYDDAYSILCGECILNINLFNHSPHPHTLCPICDKIITKLEPIGRFRTCSICFKKIQKEFKELYRDESWIGELI